MSTIAELQQLFDKSLTSPVAKPAHKGDDNDDEADFYLKCEHIPLLRADEQTHLTWLTKVFLQDTNEIVTVIDHLCDACMSEINDGRGQSEVFTLMWRRPCFIALDCDIAVLQSLAGQRGDKVVEVMSKDHTQLRGGLKN